MKPEVEIYDTTLRDGSQGEGVNFSVLDKLRIADKLDSFGVHYIEGGWPGSNPKDIEFFAEAKHKKFKKARLAAFGSTRRKDVAVADDDQVRLLLEAATPVVTIYGKTWLLHVKKVLRTSADENLAMIADTVRFLKENGKFVVYDAEHAFDGFKDNSDYALATFQAAEKAGADVIALCDTNGGTLPGEIARITGAARANVRTRLGIHTHDDAGLGVANALGGGRVACAGHCQWLRRAHRQLQLDQHHPQHRFQIGPPLCVALGPAQAQRACAVCGRNRQLAPQSAPAVGRFGGLFAQRRHPRQRGAKNLPQLRAH
jgi:2-isopropylmalate synthase